MYQINYEDGIVNRGNTSRIKEVMKKAKKGGEVCLSFIGGSITQGAVSSVAELCYAYRVYEWWQETFPKAKFKYNNAGIGGTTSQFGVARVERDVLIQKPDFVIVEFSVNDAVNEHFMETYEGLIRKIYMSESAPAVLIVHNIKYDDGKSAEEYHKKIGKYYDIPCVSMKSTIYEEVIKEEIERRSITPDDLHPNDLGHMLVANTITYYLQLLEDEKRMKESKDEKIANKAMTKNRYESSTCYQSYNTEPICNGFWVDEAKQENIADCFKNGWKAKKCGAKIEFELKGSGVAIQYRKTKDKPAPIARVIIDDRQEQAVVLDANFNEDWGDLLELTTIEEDLENTIHKIEIEIIETHKQDQKPFYLRSIIMI